MLDSLLSLLLTKLFTFMVCLYVTVDSRIHKGGFVRCVFSMINLRITRDHCVVCMVTLEAW